MKLVIPVKQYQKLLAYVKYCPYEISGLGKIEVAEKKIFTVKDLRIFRQTVSWVETKLDKKALGKFYDKIIQEEGDLSQWRLWWHSHAEMETFFSATDVATIEDFDSELPSDNWLLSLVTNHRSQMSVRLDVFEPIRYTVKNLDWDIDFSDKQLKLQAIDEIAENVVAQLPTKKVNFNKRVISWEKKKVNNGINSNTKMITQGNESAVKDIINLDKALSQMGLGGVE